MKLNYFDPVKNWQRIKPHLENEELNRVLYDGLSEYVGRDVCYPELPADFEDLEDFTDGVDWRRDRRRGRPPQYWNYVWQGACHWLVNFNLKLATLVEPRRPWRILTSDKHSTVFDGKGTLFDFNMKALLVPIEEAWELAHACNAKELPPGQLAARRAEHVICADCLAEEERNRPMREMKARMMKEVQEEMRRGEHGNRSL
jgi:hypothetical protein